MKRAYVIRVSSQKGGVGKTTIAVNLATALSVLYYRVLLVDGDTVTPSVSFLLGIEDVNAGIRDVIEKRVTLRKALIRHDPTGINVLPGTLSGGKPIPEEEKLKLLKDVLNLNYYDFVIVDTSPGHYFENIQKLYDEAIVVSTMSMPSVTSAIRFGKTYDEWKLMHTLVLNRVSNREYFSIKEVETGMGEKALAVLPEDPNVPRSEDIHIPIYMAKRNSPFSLAIRDLAIFYTGKRGEPASVYALGRGGVLGRIKQAFRRFFETLLQ